MMKRPRLLFATIVLVCLLVAGWWWLQPAKPAPASPKKTAAVSSQTKTKPQPKPKEQADKDTTANTGAAKPAPTASQSSTTDPTSPWVVVNKQHPMNPKDYAPADLTAVGGGQYLRAEAASALTRMIAAAAQDGLTVTPGSGYRSYATQVTVYNNEVRAYGQAVADSESARPGYSEHQTGWAIDLSGGGCNIEDCFGNTREGKWVAAHAADYGFVQRYTPANSAVTGYRAESWHYRYVGVSLAHQLAADPARSLESYFGVSGGPNY